MKIKQQEGLDKIDNKSVPVMTSGKVSGSAAVSGADFAFLMQQHKKHGGKNKSANFKEAKKANQRRNEKNEREFQKKVDKLV